MQQQFYVDIVPIVQDGVSHGAPLIGCLLAIIKSVRAEDVHETSDQ